MIQRIFRLIWREVRRTTKDHGLLLTLLGAPILYAFMYGSIYSNKIEEKVKVAVVDADESYYSRFLTSEINSSPMIAIVPATNLQIAQQSLYKGEVQGYFYIEKGFEKKLLALQQANVTLAVNAARFLPASDITAAITKICMTIGAGVRKIYFNKQGMNDEQAMSNTNPINLDYRALFNENTGYGPFILPGLLAIILQQTLLIGMCSNMALERQQNTIRTWYRLARANISTMIVGKSTFIFLVFMIFSQFFVYINFSVFDMPFRGSHIELAILFAIFIGSIIPLALLIGSFFKTSLLTVQVMAFSSYPIFMITGYSMPLQALPSGVQLLSNLLPTTPFLHLYTLMVQGGARLTDQPQQILHLLILASLYLALLFWRLKLLTSPLKPVNRKNEK